MMALTQKNNHRLTGSVDVTLLGNWNLFLRLTQAVDVASHGVFMEQGK